MRAKPSNQRWVLAAILILVSFIVGFVFTPESSANCATGTIGNCQDLEILYEQCLNGCDVETCYSPYTYPLCCYKVMYECHAPRAAIYTVGACNGQC
jgi:hypothetical protein